MPTVPNFANEQEKITWIRYWFNDRAHFDNAVISWKVRAERCTEAIHYSGQLSAAILTCLSGVQAAINGTINSNNHVNINNTDLIINTNSTEVNSNSSASSVITYVQIAIGLSVGLVSAACKVVGDNYSEASKNANHAFDPTFFAANPNLFTVPPIAPAEKATDFELSWWGP